MNPTGPANKYAALFTNILEVEKNKALKQHYYNYEECMTLSKQAKSGLIWLIENLANSSAPIAHPKPDYIIKTDASEDVWGCFDPQVDTTTGGSMECSEQ